DGGEASRQPTAKRAGDELADAGRERHQSGGVPGVVDGAPRETEGNGRQRQRSGHAIGDLGILSSLTIPGPGLGGAGVLDDIRELYARSPRRAWDRYQAELRNTLRWAAILERWPWLAPALSQEEAQSFLRGMPDEFSSLVVNDRTTALRCFGN